MVRKKRGRSAAFMRSINPHLKHKRHIRRSSKGGGYMARKKTYRRHRSSSIGGSQLWNSIIGWTCSD